LQFVVKRVVNLQNQRSEGIFGIIFEILGVSLENSIKAWIVG
jgi:hypothetical protein